MANDNVRTEFKILFQILDYTCTSENKNRLFNREETARLLNIDSNVFDGALISLKRQHLVNVYDTYFSLTPDAYLKITDLRESAQKLEESNQRAIEITQNQLKNYVKQFKPISNTTNNYLAPVNNVINSQNVNIATGNTIETKQENKKNDENDESRKLSEEQLKDIKPNKWYRKASFILTVLLLIAALVTIAIMIWH